MKIFRVILGVVLFLLLNTINTKICAQIYSSDTTDYFKIDGRYEIYRMTIFDESYYLDLVFDEDETNKLFGRTLDIDSIFLENHLSIQNELDSIIKHSYFYKELIK